MNTRIFPIDFIEGTHTWVILLEKINFLNIENIYHRENLCLKIFKIPYRHHVEIKDAVWSNEQQGFKENLLECTKIQNLLAFQRLAPRVYDLIFLQGNKYKYAAWIMDYISNETLYEERLNVIQKQTKKILDYCEKVGIKAHDIGDGRNMRNGLFVDTQEFEFTNYEYGLKQRLLTGLAYAGDTDIPYQGIEEMAITGRRVNSERERLLEIPDLPRDFTVLDFGCNGAYFMRRAFDRGASYGVGVDVSRVNEAARELNNYLGYFNMDFVEKVPDMEFDLVLLLSAFSYANVDEIFPKAKVALIEGHCLNNQHTEEYYRTMLEKYYPTVITRGWTQDDPNLPPRVVMEARR